MFISTIKRRLLFLCIYFSLCFIIMFLFFKEIFFSNNILIDFAIHPFNICEKYPDLWKFIKISYLISFTITSLVIANFIYALIFNKNNITENSKSNNNSALLNDNNSNENLNLLVGKDLSDNYIYIPEKGLYQNILITGTIGSGKTSSAMYPFTRQLIEYKADNNNEKLGLLILDVKGNYHKQVEKYCNLYGRQKDLMVLSLDGNIRYNPLDKPHLKPHILANRLKTILTLFSSKNGEQYWLDKAEH